MEKIWVKCKDNGSSFTDLEQGITLGGVANEPKEVVKTANIQQALLYRAIVEVDAPKGVKKVEAKVETEKEVETPVVEEVAVEETEKVEETKDETEEVEAKGKKSGKKDK